jgi:hypothetical protein
MCIYGVSRDVWEQEKIHNHKGDDCLQPAA